MNTIPPTTFTFTANPLDDTISQTYSYIPIPISNGIKAKRFDLKMWGGGGSGYDAVRIANGGGGSSMALLINSLSIPPIVNTYSVEVGGGGVKTDNYGIGKNSVFSYDGIILTAYGGGAGRGISGEAAYGGGGGGAGGAGINVNGTTSAPGPGSNEYPIKAPAPNGVGGEGGHNDPEPGGHGVTGTKYEGTYAGFSYTVITGSGGGGGSGATGGPGLRGGIGADSYNGNSGGLQIEDPNYTVYGGTGAGGYGGPGGNSGRGGGAAPGSGAGGGGGNLKHEDGDDPYDPKTYGAPGGSGLAIVTFYYD